MSVALLCTAAGCGPAKVVRVARQAEKQGADHEAYDNYCLAARQSPGGDAAAGIKRTQVGAAQHWEAEALEAMNEGRYADAWRMWMRTLEIRPDHPTAPQAIRQLQERHPVEVQAAQADWLRRGSVALAQAKPGTPTTVGPAQPSGERRLAAAQPTLPPPAVAAAPKPVDRTGGGRATPTTGPSSDVLALASPKSKAVPSVTEPPVEAPDAQPLSKTPGRAPDILPLPETRAGRTPAIEDHGAAKDAYHKTTPKPADMPPTDRPAPKASETHADRPLALQGGGSPPEPGKPVARDTAKTSPPRSDQARPAESPKPPPSRDDEEPRAQQKRETPALVTPRTSSPPPSDRPVASDKTRRSDEVPQRSRQTDPPRREVQPAARPAQRPEAADFLVVRTLSKKDHRYPTQTVLVDGITATIRDTDDDLDVDIDLHRGKDRIKKVRGLEIGGSQIFPGQSGKLYWLTVLSVHHPSRTARIGIAPAIGSGRG